MKYLFVYICNIISKDGVRNKKESVWFEALLFLSLGTLAWLFLLLVVFYFYVRNEKLPAVPSSIVLLGIPFIIFYYFIIHNKRYEAIFEEFRKETTSQNNAGKIIAVLYIFVPIITVMIVSMAWHNKF